MDSMTDTEGFRKVLARLCATMDRPFTEELVDAWWKSLRHVPFEIVKAKIESFIANVGKDDRFPRPAMMRPPEMDPPADGQHVANHVRDFWRSVIVHEVAYQLGLHPGSFAAHVVQLRASLGESLRQLLDELTTEDMQTGRSAQMHERAKRRCEEAARAYQYIATKDAPILRNKAAA
jgi:hypothetical protein